MKMTTLCAALCGTAFLFLAALPAHSGGEKDEPWKKFLPEKAYKELVGRELKTVEKGMAGDFKDAIKGKVAAVMIAAYTLSAKEGKKEDLDMYVRVFREALARGQRVHPDVECFIQFGSVEVRQYCEERGYLEVLRDVGAHIIEPSCGACINAGPGVSTLKTQVVVSAQNRMLGGYELVLLIQCLVLFVYVAGTVRTRDEVRFLLDALTGVLLFEALLIMAFAVTGVDAHSVGLDTHVDEQITTSGSFVAFCSQKVVSSPAKSKLLVLAVSLSAIQWPGLMSSCCCLSAGEGSLLGSMRTTSGSKSSFGFSRFCVLFLISSSASSSR